MKVTWFVTKLKRLAFIYFSTAKVPSAAKWAVCKNIPVYGRLSHSPEGLVCFTGRTTPDRLHRRYQRLLVGVVALQGCLL